MLIALGVARSIWAFGLPGSGKWLGLIGGVISIILGFMIIMGWPASSLWVIGLFIAVDLIFYGATAIAVGLSAKRAG